MLQIQSSTAVFIKKKWEKFKNSIFETPKQAHIFKIPFNQKNSTLIKALP